jgi:hypothetical protein
LPEVLSDEVRRHGRQLVELSVRDACYDLGIGSRRETGRSKPLPKRCYPISDGGRLSRMQKADAPFSHLLRDCSERPCGGGAAHNHQELAPQHGPP